MALSARCTCEVRTTGSDSNAGGFSPQAFAANFLTDLTASDANTDSPVVSSATYTFVTGDVNDWLFVSSGTNWRQGFYQITAVNAGAATLNAAVGAALHTVVNSARYRINTTAGCATVASPTGGVCALDASQRDAAKYTGTNLAVDATTATDVTPDGVTPSKIHVGNLINITGGAGFTAGVYEITNIVSGKWRLDRAPAATSTSGGTWNYGGAVATPGFGGTIAQSSGFLWIRAGTYLVTSASVQVSGGCVFLNGARYVEGYSTLRRDRAARPIVRASGISTFSLFDSGGSSYDATICYLELDGASLTSSRGLYAQASGISARLCVFRNFTNTAQYSGWGDSNLYTGCNQATFNGAMIRCVATGNTNGYYVGYGRLHECISYNNTGWGFQLVTNSSCDHCIAYGNGSYGFRLTSSPNLMTGCIAVNNTGQGFYMENGATGTYCYYCATYGNTAGSGQGNETDSVGDVILTGNPFVDPANGNFALNAVAGAGAELRGILRAYTGIPTIDYGAIGPVEPYDPTPAEIADAIWGYTNRTLT
jgi:hypothetical protein